MRYTLEIHRLVGETTILHHRQTLDLPCEREAAKVLDAARSSLPVGFGASMTYSAPGTGTVKNVRVALALGEG